MEANAFQEHNLLKDSVIMLLEEAKDTFSVHFGSDKEANIKAFEELAEKTRNGRFSIIVVGEFSSGKSTFLNAIMHEKYLDSFSSETTANINFLRSVNDSPTGKPMIRVNYKDGKCETSEDVSFTNIQKYVSTKGVDVAATIDNVEIFLDSPFLNEGVDLIDSPGLNGVKELHADITRNQMKASHAAIFMFRATQPGSKSDFQTLIDLKKSCKSIIVVLNRIDEAAKIGEESIEDIVNKLKGTFKDMFPDETIPEVWPISAYKALVARSQLALDYNQRTVHTAEEKENYLKTSLIVPLENRLMRYITKGEKAKNELLSPVEKVISVISEASNELEVEKETLNGKFSTDDLTEQIDIVNEEIKSVKKAIENKKVDVENAISDAVRNAKNAIKSDTKDLKERMLLNLDSETDLSDLETNAKRYVSRIYTKYQAVYSDALEMLETDFRNALRRNIEGSLAIINKNLSSTCNGDNTLPIQSIEIDSSYFNAKYDLSKYDLEIAEKLKERKKTLDDQYKAEDNQSAAERIESKIESINEFIQSAEERHRADLARLRDPGVVMRSEPKEVEYRKERSIFNPRRWFGSKWTTGVKQYMAEVPDYTGHDLYERQKAELEKKHQCRICELEERKKVLEEKQSTFLSGSINVRRYEQEREVLEHQIDQLRTERDAALNKVIKNQLKDAKTYVEEIFTSLEQNSRKQAIKAIEDKEELLTQMSMQILESEIKDELEIKIKKLESLKSKVTLAEKDKNERIQKMEEASLALNALLDKAEALRVAIESIETDIIKEQ